jgi:hypothetical protein
MHLFLVELKILNEVEIDMCIKLAWDIVRPLKVFVFSPHFAC